MNRVKLRRCRCRILCHKRKGQRKTVFCAAEAPPGLRFKWRRVKT